MAVKRDWWLNSTKELSWERQRLPLSGASFSCKGCHLIPPLPKPCETFFSRLFDKRRWVTTKVKPISQGMKRLFDKRFKRPLAMNWVSWRHRYQRWPSSWVKLDSFCLSTLTRLDQNRSDVFEPSFAKWWRPFVPRNIPWCYFWTTCSGPTTNHFNYCRPS